jgi:hypothetical protein
MYTTGVNETGGKWKKSSSRKILIILFGHLWIVELTYILIFAFKFTLTLFYTCGLGIVVLYVMVSQPYGFSLGFFT